MWDLRQTNSRRDVRIHLENLSKNKVLGVNDGFVKLMESPEGHTWEKGEADKQGFFTLTNPSSQKLLTATASGILVLQGWHEFK